MGSEIKPGMLVEIQSNDFGDVILKFAKNQKRESDILSADFGDAEALLNLRNWLQDILEQAGATVEGAGVGMGQADLDIRLQGHLFNVTIRPTK